MQECYYNLSTRNGKAHLAEVVSDENTKGEKLKGIFFKKVFKILGERLEFEHYANRELVRIGEKIKKPEAIRSFLVNCTSSPNYFGLEE